MLPAISDEESDSEFVVAPPHPGRGASTKYKAFSEEANDVSEEEPKSKRSNGRGKKAAPPPVEDEEDEEEDEDEELAEDEYIVEEILGHVVEKGVPKFQIKWEGYDDPSDITWEPEDTLRAGAEDILEAYLAKHGGLEAIIDEATEVTKSKKRNRKSVGVAAKTEKASKRSQKSHPVESPAPVPVKAFKEWHPPNDSWEDHIETIDVLEEQEADGKPVLKVYLNWKNGKKTKHSTDVVYKRCPQKMLRFYETHVKIHKTSDY